MGKGKFMARRESKRLPFTLLLTSLLLHLLVFAASSREALWKERPRPGRPLKFRVVSVEEKPAEKRPPNPDSRFLSNANRKESGAGAPAKPPRLRREREERLAARRGAPAPRVAALPPPESRPPAPPAPPPAAPPDREPEKARKPSAASEKRKPRAAKKPRRRRARPAPAVRKKARRRVVRKEPPRVKRKARPARKPKEKVKVAALRPPPRPRRPAPRPPAPADPLAMFRVKPRPEGKPRAPSLDLSDEHLDRIAKRSADSEAEGAGEVVSLDTRDSRYAAYFAHIKRRIYGAWIWPVEAQRYRGRLSLVFALRKDGTLGAVRVTSSSGAKILDDLAQAAVTKAAPFEPLPPGIKRAPLRIEARFLYE